MSLNEITKSISGVKDILDSVDKLPKNLSLGARTFEISSALRKLSAMSKFLGGVGAILNLVDLFIGGPSATEEILKEISLLNRKIDSLSEHIDDRFNELKNFIEKIAGSTIFVEAKSEIDGLNRVISVTWDSSSPKERQSPDSNVNKMLKSYKLSDIYTRANEIKELITCLLYTSDAADD